MELYKTAESHYYTALGYVVAIVFVAGGFYAVQRAHLTSLQGPDRVRKLRVLVAGLPHSGKRRLWSCLVSDAANMSREAEGGSSYRGLDHTLRAPAPDCPPEESSTLTPLIAPDPSTSTVASVSSPVRGGGGVEDEAIFLPSRKPLYSPLKTKGPTIVEPELGPPLPPPLIPTRGSASETAASAPREKSLASYELNDLFRDKIVVSCAPDYFPDYLPTDLWFDRDCRLCAVVFCVDGSSLAAVKESAVALYNILNSRAWERKKVSLLLYVSHYDPARLEKSVIRAAMEEQIDRERRRSSSATIGDNDDETEEEFVVPYGNDFVTRWLDHFGRRRVIHKLHTFTQAITHKLRHENEPLRLTKEKDPNAQFRFRNLITPLCRFICEENTIMGIETCKAFVQRASVLPA